MENYYMKIFGEMSLNKTAKSVLMQPNAMYYSTRLSPNSWILSMYKCMHPYVTNKDHPPWQFPNSLMLPCTYTYHSVEIVEVFHLSYSGVGRSLILPFPYLSTPFQVPTCLFVFVDVFFVSLQLDKRVLDIHYVNYLKHLKDLK